MAIIIEEDRNRLSVFALVGWVAVLVGIIVAVYFLFFKSVGKLEPQVPPGLVYSQEILELNITPSAILGELNQRRERYVVPTRAGVVGRKNPFLPL